MRPGGGGSSRLHAASASTQQVVLCCCRVVHIYGVWRFLFIMFVVCVSFFVYKLT